METKSIIVFSQKMAGWLMYQGFVLIQIRPDKKNNTKNVFFFKESEEIRNKISEYLYNEQLKFKCKGDKDNE